MPMEPTELRAAIEAILFVSNEPVKVDDLAEAFSDEGREAVLAQLDEIKRLFDANVGGFMVEQTAGGWRLATRPDHHDVLKKYFARKGTNRLSLAALETLAIVAYRQPITRPEIEDLRGVDCGAVTKALLERKLIRILGKKDEPGRPLIYGTSKEFLELFNLRDLTQLPTLREFQELSEESRKIVEEETPAPAVAGLTELAQDPAAAQRIEQSSMESERALAALESAMEEVDEMAKPPK